jgi:hypothetical protein
MPTSFQILNQAKLVEVTTAKYVEKIINQLVTKG